MLSRIGHVIPPRTRDCPATTPLSALMAAPSSDGAVDKKVDVVELDGMVHAPHAAPHTGP